MEEDSEVLDWGNEDDEAQASESLRAHSQQKQSDSATWTGGDQEEAEDAVSLGGEEDEEVYAYSAASAAREHTPKYQDPSSRTPSQQRTSVDRKHDSHPRDNSGNSSKPPSSQAQRAPSVGKLTHALPPKPAVAPPPYIPTVTTHPSTLASSMIPRDRRANGHAKPTSNSQDAFDGLPADWEVRYPRNGGRDAYYYNVRTHESTWTRPRAMTSRRSSLSKERESDSMPGGGDRSPVRGLTDEGARNVRKDNRSHASPGGSLTYEDRHYRPDGQNGPDLQTNRRDSYSSSPRSHIRASSPPLLMTDERRMARSPSPPPRRRSRSVERPGRGPRRDISPSASDRNTWRDSPRDDLHSRQGPPQERAWGRPHDMLLSENTSVRLFDDRPTVDRGRRHRMDVEPPAQPTPIPQDTRNNSNNEWSASRYRSTPPHLREMSPPRRAPPLDLPQRPPSPRYRGRNEHRSSPVTPRDVPRTLPDSYVPTERVPQRRGRELDAEYGNDVKRRRVEESLGEPNRYHPAMEDRSVPPSLPDKPSASHSAQLEQPRLQKRAPLPPQSARYRDAFRVAPPPQSMPIPDATSPSSQVPLPRQAVDDTAPRGPSRGFREIPLGPRSQTQPQPPTEPERDEAMPPHSTSGRSRTRWGNALPPSTSLSAAPERPRDAMDIDYSPRMSVPRTDDMSSRAAGNSRNEYPPAETPIAPPTGPRAMTRNAPGFGPAREPPSASGPPTPVALQGPPGGARGPPPKSPVSKSGLLPQRPTRERVEPPLPPTMTRAGMQGLPQGPRGYDASRGMPGSADLKGQSRSHHMKVSGTNSIPLGSRASLGPPERAESTRPTSEGWRENPTTYPPGSIIYETEPPRRPPSTYTPSSPAIQHRALPDTVESASQRVPQSDRRDVVTPMNSERPYTPSLSPRPPQRSRRDSSPSPNEKSGRASRFGPTGPGPDLYPPPAQKTEERIWLTREEGESLTRSEPSSQPNRSSWAQDGRARPSRFDAPLRQEQARAIVEESASTKPWFQRGRKDTFVRDREAPAHEAPPPKSFYQRGHKTSPARAREGSVDNRQQARPTSLERRLSSQLEPQLNQLPQGFQGSTPELPRGREHNVDHDFVYQEGRPQSIANDDKHSSRAYDTQRMVQPWDRQVEDIRPLTPPVVRVHPERARFFEPGLPDDRANRPVERTRWPEPMPSSFPPVREPSPAPKGSKGPIRIRRPPKSPREEVTELHRPSRELNSTDVQAAPPQTPPRIPPQRPLAQRGASLLDRLKLDSPPLSVPGPSSSLRDRVELPMKRAAEDIHGLPPRPSVEAVHDTELSPDIRGRGRRRNGKVKRGRR